MNKILMQKFKQRIRQDEHFLWDLVSSFLTGTVHLSHFGYKMFKVFHLGPYPNFNLSLSLARRKGLGRNAGDDSSFTR